MPDFVICAYVVVCEKILEESDNVLSAIRMVEVFGVKPLHPDAGPNALPLVQTNCLAVVKTKPDYPGGSHTVELRMLNTQGQLTTIGRHEKVTFGKLNFAGEEVAGGMNFGFQMNLGVKNFGLCYACLYLDGEEIARSPFTLWRHMPAREIE